MALEDILNTLQAEAEQEIDKINKQADKELSELQKVYDEKYSTERQKSLSEIKSQIQREVDMELFQVKSSQRRKLLQAKREVLDKIFAQALKRLTEISDSDYVKLLAKLMNDINESSGDISASAGKEKQTAEAIKSSGKHFTLATETIPAVGGFMWQGKNVTIDMTFESLVEDLRSQIEMEISQDVFKD